jgi:phage-related protein (TIGR01555 family)
MIKEWFAQFRKPSKSELQRKRSEAGIKGNAVRWGKVAKPSQEVRNPSLLTHALSLAADKGQKAYHFPLREPVLMPGVVPQGTVAAIAMDSDIPGMRVAWQYLLMGMRDFVGFPGYQYLAELATRAEFRAMASALSTELTREWITLNSSETAGDSTKAKITELEAEMKRLGLQGVIQKAAEHDAYFGRGQIFIDLKGQDRSTPLILDSRTIGKDSLNRITTVEPMWTTPLAYNALDPVAPDFYRPTSWWMLGQPAHATRLLTVITRPLPDMLKPAFNFSGMSLSQLAQPYVDNWLRTRQSVSDLVSNFSIISLATSMEQVLSGGDDGSDLFKRAELFTLTRSNKGVFLTDKDREELTQIAVPLGGLAELQSQAQQQMCMVSHEPEIIMTGISPAGLNASSEGEIQAWENWTRAQQEAFWRSPIEIILKVMQLSMYGEIDEEITFAFNPLFALSGKDLAAIRTADGATAVAYIDRGVLDPTEERERLARDPDSGYQGLDLSVVPELPEPVEPKELTDGESEQDDTDSET